MIVICVEGNVEMSGQSQIRNFDQKILGIDQNVGRLQIAMEGQIPVHVVDSPDYLLENIFNGFSGDFGLGLVQFANEIGQTHLHVFK